jgi:hypothetical protein
MLRRVKFLLGSGIVLATLAIGALVAVTVVILWAISSTFY